MLLIKFTLGSGCEAPGKITELLKNKVVNLDFRQPGPPPIYFFPRPKPPAWTSDRIANVYLISYLIEL